MILLDSESIVVDHRVHSKESLELPKVHLQLTTFFFLDRNYFMFVNEVRETEVELDKSSLIKVVYLSMLCCDCPEVESVGKWGPGVRS